MAKRPLVLTIFGWFLMAAGAVGFFAHLPLHRAWRPDDAWPLGLELVLLLTGIFILQRQNWARWLAVGWIAFHVGLSFYNSLREVAAHTVILLIFVGILFHPAANAWFRGRAPQDPPPNPA